MLEEVPRQRVRISALGIIAYALCFLMLVVVWLSETGHLPGGYNKTPRPFAVGVMLVISMVLGVGGVALTLLLALTPRKRRPYWQRFVRRLPFGLLITMSFALIGSTNGVYTWHRHGFAQGTEKDLERRNIPPAEECARVHDGSFSSYGVRFVRKGDRQAQFDLGTNAVEEYRVDWLDPCTYRLTRVMDQEVAMTVHITHVHADGGYRCMAKWEGGDIAELMVHASPSAQPR